MIQAHRSGRGFGRAASRALAVVAVLAAQGAAARAWQPYRNARFGFALDVPADFRAGRPPDNGDGLAFSSADGQVRIAASGQYLETEGDLARDEAAAVSAETGEGLRVTYRVRTASGYTVSGTLGDRIVYIHAVPTCGRSAAATVRIDYPASDKARMDAVVGHVAATLKGSARC